MIKLIPKFFFALSILFFLSNSVYSQNAVLEFDGVDDYLDIGATAGDNIRTIEMWFKCNEDIDSTLQEAQCLFVRDTEIDGAGNNPDEFGAFFNHEGWPNPGTIRYKSNSSDGLAVYDVYSDQNKWNKDQWYHFAVVIDTANGISMFIDGVKQADSQPSYTLATAERDEKTTFGAQILQSIRYFDGSVDEIHFSKQALYSSNFTPPCNITSTDSSTGLWKFEESSGSVAIDSSSQGNDGTIYGAARNSEVVCSSSSTIQFSKIKNIIDVIVYPNPTKESIAFEFSTYPNDNQGVVIEITDNLGTLVYSGPLNNQINTIDLSGVASGSYNYRINSEGLALTYGHFVIL